MKCNWAETSRVDVTNGLKVNLSVWMVLRLQGNCNTTATALRPCDHISALSTSYLKAIEVRKGSVRHRHLQWAWQMTGWGTGNWHKDPPSHMSFAFWVTLVICLSFFWHSNLISHMLLLWSQCLFFCVVKMIVDSFEPPPFMPLMPYSDCGLPDFGWILKTSCKSFHSTWLWNLTDLVHFVTFVCLTV